MKSLKSIFLLSIILIGNQFISYAQTFILYGDKTLGGDKGEVLPNIIYAGSNQLIIAGTSGTNINGDKTEPVCDSTLFNPADIWVVKIDTGFNILWNKDLGGYYDESYARLLKVNDNKIIFSCWSQSDSSCEKSEDSRGSVDYWVCTIDSNGSKIMDKTYGGTDNEFSSQIIQLPSGDYILGGLSSSGIGADKTVSNYGSADYWLLKLDSMGNKTWDKVYGGSIDELEGYYGGIRYLFQLLNDQGTDFILQGTTNSPQSGTISDTSRGWYDGWLIKLDSAGTPLWDKRYGGTGVDLFSHIVRTDDNGYIIAGSTDSPQGYDVSDSSRGGFDVWVLKLDSLGNKQWDKRYGGNNADYGNWIEKAPGGGYWVSGYTSSDSSSEVTETSYGLEDYWIFKIDNSGNKLWDKRFGASGVDWASSFVIMPDSSIFLCGFAEEGTSAVKTDYGKGMRDYWLVHFKYTDNTTGIQSNTNENNFVSIYPNPAKDIIYINTKYDFKAAAINIYDAAGRKVMDKKIKGTASVSIKELKAGIYVYEIKDAKGNAGRGKVVKE